MDQMTEMLKPSQLKPWLKVFPKEALTAEVPKCTAYRYLRQENEEHLNEPALHYYGANISYGEFFERIENCAKAFAALGIKPGEMVSFLSVSIPETVVALYALNKLGATANMIDPRMDVDTICDRVVESDSRILITLDIAFPKVRRIREAIAQELIIVQSPSQSLPPIKRMLKNMISKNTITYDEEVITWDDFLAKGKGAVAKEAPYVGDAVVAITYTGGTTGIPKGVMMTNDSMNAVAINFRYCGIYYRRKDRFLGIIPIFSAYGLVCGLHMPLALGLTMVLVPNFQPQTMGKLVMQFRPQHMVSVPAFYEILMESREVKGKDLSFLITLGSGGDTMNEGLENKLKAFLLEHNIKYPLAQGYGMSEISAAASFCVNDIYKPGSVGVPSVVTTVGIFKPGTSEELGFNELGEICISGPTLMKGYFLRPEETEKVMWRHPDGEMWIHSGDIGYLDEEGFLFVQGRVKRMITRFDGHKIFPVSIESLVAEYPLVRNCCVIGVADRGHGQGHHPLVLVMLDDCDKYTVCREIFDICNTQLEERGRPVGVIAIDDIPLTGMGKNDYRALEKTYGKFDYTQLNMG